MNTEKAETLRETEKAVQLASVQENPESGESSCRRP